MFFKTILGSFKIILGYFRPFKIILDQFKAFQGGSVFSERRPPSNRRIRLTQCCIQFRSVRVKVLCVFYLHDNIAFTFKRYGTEYLEQNVLFPKDLNWVQHGIGLFIYSDYIHTAYLLLNSPVTVKLAFSGHRHVQFKQTTYSYFKKCCRGERRMSVVERRLHD